MSFQEFLDYKLLNFTVSQLIHTLILILILMIAIRLINHFVGKAIERIRVERSLHTFIRSVIKVVLYFLAILIIADDLSVNVSSLLALFSVASLAVSLAIQGTLSNVASGVTILIHKPFVVGDYIETASVAGTVRDITMINTHLLTPDNKLIYVPNSDLASAQITNYTYMDTRRVDVNVTASYDCDPELVKKALQEAIAATDKVLMDPPPLARIADYGSSSISYVIRTWAKTADYWDVHFDLIENIHTAFKNNNVEMTYDHINVHMINDK